MDSIQRDFDDAVLSIAATDPLATAGTGIAVAGAATIPTLGPIMVLMTLIGIVLMVIANRRSPHDRRL